MNNETVKSAMIGFLSKGLDETAFDLLKLKIKYYLELDLGLPVKRFSNFVDEILLDYK